MKLGEDYKFLDVSEIPPKGVGKGYKKSKWKRILSSIPKGKALFFEAASRSTYHSIYDSVMRLGKLYPEKFSIFTVTCRKRKDGSFDVYIYRKNDLKKGDGEE